MAIVEVIAAAIRHTAHHVAGNNRGEAALRPMRLAAQLPAIVAVQDELIEARTLAVEEVSAVKQDLKVDLQLLGQLLVEVIAQRRATCAIRQHLIPIDAPAQSRRASATTTPAYAQRPRQRPRAIVQPKLYHQVMGISTPRVKVIGAGCSATCGARPTNRRTNRRTNRSTNRRINRSTNRSPSYPLSVRWGVIPCCVEHLIVWRRRGHLRLRPLLRGRYRVF